RGRHAAGLRAAPASRGVGEGGRFANGRVHSDHHFSRRGTRRRARRLYRRLGLHGPGIGSGGARGEVRGLPRDTAGDGDGREGRDLSPLPSGSSWRGSRGIGSRVARLRRLRSGREQAPRAEGAPRSASAHMSAEPEPLSEIRRARALAVGGVILVLAAALAVLLVAVRPRKSRIRAAAPKESPATVTMDAAELRSAPSSASPSLARLRRGARLSV